MTVGVICNREVVIVEKDTTIQEAARLMRSYHVGNVVVVDEKSGKRVPVGILTDRDIVLELVAEGVDLNSVTTGDAMSGNLALAKEQDDVIEAIKMMRIKGIRRMPVVDNAGALIGLVALDDLLDLLAEQLRDLADLICQEQQREQKKRD